MSFSETSKSSLLCYVSYDVIEVTELVLLSLILSLFFTHHCYTNRTMHTSKCLAKFIIIYV